MKNIRNYLECEALLHEMFKNINFCSSCSNVNSFGFKSYCTNCFEFYNMFSDAQDLKQACKPLIDERIKLYGQPIFNNNRCGYLDDKGCRLESHKSPFCISFVCDNLMKEMEEKYSIVYDDFLVANKMEKILLEELNEDELDSFKSVLKDWIIKSKGPTGI